MQEYVEERTVAISVKAAKLSGRALAAACKKVLAEMKKHHEAAKRPHGRQSVKKLMNHYGGKNAMKYVGAPKDFDRIAKEFHVDYAFHKTSPGHYLLLFKADQADAITAAFGKYTEKVMGCSQERPSILGQLRAVRGADSGKAQAEGTGQRGGEGRTVSKKIKKYVLPYFPYLIAFWFFSKCGTAYRMAAGANLGKKLFGMVKTIGPVFQSYAPGLGLLDLAVGVPGAVILYFVVQSKIKKARKFRRDMEYGSARSSA